MRSSIKGCLGRALEGTITNLCGSRMNLGRFRSISGASWTSATVLQWEMRVVLRNSTGVSNSSLIWNAHAIRS